MFLEYISFTRSSRQCSAVAEVLLGWWRLELINEPRINWSISSGKYG